MGAIRSVNAWIGGPNSVRAQYTGSQLRMLLNSRKLEPQLFYTIHRLKGLTPDKLNGLLQFTEHLMKKISVERTNLRLKFIVPPAKAFDLINFDRLLAAPEAMKKVMQECVIPDLSTKVIDFSELPWIYRNFVLTVNNE